MQASRRFNRLARTWLLIAAATLIRLQAGSIPQTQAPARSGPLAITHVTVFDSVNGSLRADVSVVVNGDRIVEVGPGDRVSAPATASIIDGRGKFLLPGLWDMHVHVFNNGEQNGTNSRDYFFPLLVANGIVGVRDLSTDPDDIVEADSWNRDIDAGRLVGPRVMVTSRVVDGEPATWSNSLIVRTPEEAKTAVRSLKASGAKLIKVYWSLSRDAYFAIADEARQQGIPFGGHVPRTVAPGEAADAGQRTIEHMDGIYAACAMRERTVDRTSVAAAVASNAYDGPACEALADRLRRNGTWLVPTIVNFWDATSVDRSSRLRFAPWLRDSAPTPPPPFVHAVSRTMRRVGRLLAGTDISIQRQILVPGLSLHDELALLVDLGFTPAEALQAATVNPAKYAGALDEFGTIEKDKRADLVVLDANPLADIRNTSKISAVVVNGRLLERTELDRLLTTAETSGRTAAPLARLSLVINSRDSGNAFAGRWEADLPVPQQITVELRVAGIEVMGAIQTGGQTVEIIGGMVNGTEMRFTFASPDKNRTIALTGRIEGDEIAFIRAVEVRPGGGPGGRGFFGVGGPGSFTARRTR